MALPDFEAWAIFAAVAEHGSFGGAARALGLSNATVSKAVARLEASMGTTLFNRTSRRIALTETGASLAERAARLLSDAVETEECAREEVGAPRGTVKLAVPMSFGLAEVGPVVADFMAAYPDITVELNLSDSLVDIVGDGYDAALRIASMPDSSLRARKLRDVDLYVVASPDWIARHSRPDSPAALDASEVFGYTMVARQALTFRHADGRDCTWSPHPANSGRGGSLHYWISSQTAGSPARADAPAYQILLFPNLCFVTLTKQKRHRSILAPRQPFVTAGISKMTMNIARRAHLFGASAMTLALCFVQTPAMAAASPEAVPAEATNTGNSDIAEGSAIVVTATKANEIAPVTSSLETQQPQSIVSRSFIQDSLPTTADFNQVALIAPSVSNFGGNNGVGLSESKAQIRGFQDGEYNITYDGVPFGDQNDPTHHSNTFWPSNTMETLVVDRGPGNASQLGQATFGGNINLFSRVPRDQLGVELLGSYGTYNTYVGQAVLQSGAVDALGGTKFVASVQYVNSDGALTNEKYRQLNFYAKAVVPISDDVTLSLIGTANRNVFNQSDSDGITLAQAAKFGQHYALSNDPLRQDYYKYNSTIKTTDFYIARLDARIAPGSSFTNSAYTYKYDNETLSGLDTTQDGLQPGQTPGAAVGAVTTTNKVKFSATGATVFGVPGYTKSNAYRVYGDIAKVKVDFGFGALTAGAWIEWSQTFRQQTEVDLITGAFNYRNSQQVAPATGANPGAITQGYVRFNQNSSMNHTEEFAELELRPLPGLTITPGFKHVDFNRKIDAIANQTTRYEQHLSKTYTADLPFLSANYQVTDNVAIYAQYARGFLMPPLSQLYVAQPGLSTADPQRSTNYQAGIVYHGSRLSTGRPCPAVDRGRRRHLQIGADPLLAHRQGHRTTERIRLPHRRI